MKRIALILLPSALVLLFSCKKDKEKVFDNTSTRDNAIAENIFSDVFKVVDEVSSETDGIRGDGIGCIDNIVVDTASWPRTVLIDFGDDYCTGVDGRVRNGQLLISYTGRYRDEGTVITITPSGYTVDGYLVQGTKVITNLGLNSNGQIHYSVHVEGSVTAPGNAYDITTISDRIRTWIGGSSTLSIWDDVYEVTGTASGTNRFDEPYHLVITQPLRIEIGCQWIVSGKLTLTPDDGTPRFINFGSGQCNQGFTVTINGNEYPINGGN
ncbi:MAG: hypothetical protein IT223_02435 [Crocinitomicaceae bacterium]|nr:hypothetical protein [Crocinitomicaceae bacterium]